LIKDFKIKFLNIKNIFYTNINPFILKIKKKKYKSIDGLLLKT